jgi:NAD(P)-dependent dehydrogenase (short-subunit alcohol dehydrogenase family)
LGVEAVASGANLAEPDNARALARAALERFGRVDILVHAAAPFVRQSLREMTLDTWRQVNGVLVESFWVLAQELTPGMTERKTGDLVAILDSSAFAPSPAYLAHAVGKSALWALACNLAVELAPWVKVNGIVPGPVLPPPGFTQAQTERVGKATLMKRWGSPQDVVNAVLYLIRSDYVTGEALFVDGGERWAK